MDLRNAAQWAAVSVALLLGIWAEIRSFRERRKADTSNFAAAWAELTALLGDALTALPSEWSADHSPQGAERIRALSSRSRNAVTIVARAFPDAAGSLLLLCDQLEEFLTRPTHHTHFDDPEVVEEMWRINQTLRLLSTVAATRGLLANGAIDFDEDRYHNEFNKRFESFRQRRWYYLRVKWSA